MITRRSFLGLGRFRRSRTAALVGTPTVEQLRRREAERRALDAQTEADLREALSGLSPEGYEALRRLADDVVHEFARGRSRGIEHDPAADREPHTYDEQGRVVECPPRCAVDHRQV